MELQQKNLVLTTSTFFILFITSFIIYELIISKNHEIALSSIVVAELLFGAKKKQSQKLTKLIDTFIGNFTIYDFDKKASVEYAKIRASLESQGNIIGANDLFIAAHTKSLGAVMVTNNTREFLRVDGLNVEDWVEYNV